ncbi:serine hydrolase [Roseateles sp.]|uniref:serine hydrolase domain-containing protein n=1 Tax=Roseateles sp. TaxID=1971397 RepID=UPI0025E96917|nr:serine hydrolase domain-containing protein [Roseateles sp.]MBV8033792.1 beta-lactamase family protein [Roseateles sp.]
MSLPPVLARVLTLLSLGAALLPAWAAPLPDSASALEQRLAERLGGDRGGACVQAAVIERDRVVRGSGCAGTRGDRAPAPDAAFEIGSVSKTMTAFLVAGLIERGRWSLDDPIARHLPEGTTVPRQGERQILVRDLLTHSAGLPGLPPGMPMPKPDDPYAALTEAQLLDALGRVTLARPIGSRAEYSNFGMMLVSLAAARSLGGDLEAALRERLFAPLGMGGAYVTRPLAARPAQGHLPGGAATSAWTITPNLAGVGMVKATLDDMVRYAQAELGSLPDVPAALTAALRLTQQPLAHGFAMNWVVSRQQGRELRMHDGGTGGFSSLVVLEPGAQRAVVLLADTALEDLGGLGDLGLALLGLDVPLRPRREVAMPPALRQALVGDWEVGGMTLHIREADDGRLLAQARGDSEFELRQDSRGDLYPTSFSALLRLERPEAEGRPVQRLSWHQGGGMMQGRRVEAAPAIANPAWRDWAGEYQLAPQFSLRVFERDGRLMVQGSGQPAIAAEPVGADRIEIKVVGAVVEFERDAAGQVVAAQLRQNGQVLRGARR